MEPTMSKTFNTSQNEDGSYGIDREQNEINSLVKEGNDLVSVFSHVNQEVTYANNMLMQAAQTTEYAVQRYYNAEADRQMVVNNENRKYDSLLFSQDNLLDRINTPEIRIWRYENQLYYRSNNGQLIIGNQVEIKKELSSRYGGDIHIVNDLNDVLNNNIRVNTIFIAINNLPVVEEELFNLSTNYELSSESFPNFNIVWKRNLLASTRFLKQRLIASSGSITDTKKLMLNIIENKSDYIPQWIGNIGIGVDTILLLVGNKSVSEDLIVQRIIEQLFNTNIVVTITDNMLKEQTLQEITKGKLFFHINQIPEDKENQEKLKELIISLMIQQSIRADGYTIPTQGKIIVTIDEPHVFFKEFMEICTTLFIDTIDNIRVKLNINSNIVLYQNIENSLNYFSNEILSLRREAFNSNRNENQRFIEQINETDLTIENSNKLAILDPYSDGFETLIPKGDYHTLVTGLTRIGKSYLLLSVIMRHIIRNDCSIILFDIHSDLAKKVVKLVKEKERLAYIYPSLDTFYSPTTNLFDTEDKSEKNIAKLSQMILRVLKSIKMDESFSGSMEELLLNCIRILLRKGEGSFKELYRFMNDKRNEDLVKYAKNSPNQLEEEYFKDYFSSVTTTKDAVRRRLSTLLNDPLFSNLMNGTNTINLEKEMNTAGKIIIIDIPKGEMETTYEYYIKFMLEYIQVLALKRVEIPRKEDRTLTHLFIDEAHNFITPNGNIETILTEAGKYNLYLTMANQAISQYKNTNLRDIILSMTDAKIIGKNSNDTLIAMNKTLNTKLEDVENLSKGEFYSSIANNGVVKFKNTGRFLDESEENSFDKQEEIKKYQLEHYYRPLNDANIKTLTSEDIMSMVKIFKADIISKNLTQASCLQKLELSEPKRFKEIAEDFEYVTTKEEKYQPRIRQKEISIVFKLAFELHNDLDNTKFIQMLKGKDDMFNKTASGTRLGKFTHDGTSKTEQYYYF
jgi:hypothetical protein